MTNLVPGFNPPTVGVPGPYVPPIKPRDNPMAVRQPGWRTMTVPHDTTVGEVAERVYGSRNESQRVFLHNRISVVRPDGSAGFLAHPNQIIRQGQTLWLTN